MAFQSVFPCRMMYNIVVSPVVHLNIRIDK
jgi:hypothetical protein